MDKYSKTWRIAAYARVSREDGNDIGASIINQKKIMEEFIKEFFKDTDYTL